MIKNLVLSVFTLAATNLAFPASFTPRGLYAEEIASDIAARTGRATRINLQNKPLCFATEDKLFSAEEVSKVVRVIPDSVKILDLSLNRMPEDALPAFIHLLQRPSFSWLDITTNSGADSLEGIRHLTTALGSAGKSLVEQVAILKKVIWVREESIDHASRERIIPLDFAVSHRSYYQERKSLDTTAVPDLWASLGIK